LASIYSNLEEELVLEIYDKDLASSDLLGTAGPLSIKELVRFEGLCEHNIEI